MASVTRIAPRSLFEPLEGDHSTGARRKPDAPRVPASGPEILSRFLGRTPPGLPVTRGRCTLRNSISRPTVAGW